MANEILQEVIFHDEELTNYLFSNRITVVSQIFALKYFVL